MTIDALYVRVRRHLERDEFRIHYGMTRLAAEGHRLRVFVRLITAEGTHGNEQESADKQNSGDATLAWLVEIDRRIGAEIG